MSITYFKIVKIKKSILLVDIMTHIIFSCVIKDDKNKPIKNIYNWNVKYNIKK